MKKEAKAQIEFNQYLREKRMHGFFELKYTEKDYLPFNKIESHQYDGLQATERDGLVWKLSDEDRRQKPCDTLSIPPLPSYLVIRFPDGFYLVRIKYIVALKDSGALGITLDQAKMCAELIVHT